MFSNIWILTVATVVAAQRYNNIMMEFPDLNFNEENNYLTEFFGPSSTMNQPLFASPPRITSQEKHIVTYSEHESPDEKSNRNNNDNNNNDNKMTIREHLSEYEPYHNHGHNYHHSNYHHHHEERVPIAVLSYHHHKYVEVPEHHVSYKPTVIDLNGKLYPIMLQFNSHSSPLVTTHRHHHHQNHYEETSHMDEPHHHVHTIQKPIIQEIREIITPYKNVFRVVKPMKENVKTYIHKHNKYDDHNHHDHRYSHPQEYADNNIQNRAVQAQSQAHIVQQSAGPNPQYSFEDHQPKFTFDNQATTELRAPITQESSVEHND